MKLQSIENELGLLGDLVGSRSWYWQSEDTNVTSRIRCEIIGVATPTSCCLLPESHSLP